MPRSMEPIRVPTLPAAIPAAAPARRPAPAGIQPLVDLAPAARRSVQPGRQHRVAALPQPDPRLRGADRLGRAPRRPGFPRGVPRRHGRLRQVHGQRVGPLVPAPARTRSPARSPISAPSSASMSRSGSTPAASASSPATTRRQASDMALPFIGVGLLYRKGYFRQTIDADGHQEHAYPDYDLSRLPVQRVAGPRRRSAPRARRAAGPHLDGRRLPRPGRPHAGAAPRHGPPGERPGRPADHPHPLRPRSRDAAPPGARARRRRRPGAAGARHRAGGVAPQRGPLGVPALRARA